MVVDRSRAAPLILAVIGLALAAAGKLNIWLIPFYYIFGYFLVIANSLRLVRFGEEFTQAEEAQPASNATFMAAPSTQTSVVTKAAATAAAMPATRAIPTL